MGLSIGPSPRHTRNANLILNSQTVTVSSQFHVQCDNFYETTKEENATTMINSWSILAGFTNIKYNTDYILRGSMPSERTKKTDQEVCLPTSTEDDTIKDVMD